MPTTNILSELESVITTKNSLLVFKVEPLHVGKTFGKTLYKAFGACIFNESDGIPWEPSDCDYGDTIAEVLWLAIERWG